MDLRQVFKEITSHPHFVPWIIFFFFTTIYFASTVGIMNSGDGTQYALTKSLVEKQSIAIDSYANWTYYADYAVYKNHMYSDREFGQSIFGIPFYIVGKLILPLTYYPYNGRHAGLNDDTKIQLLTILSTAVISAIGLVLFHLLSFSITKSKLASLISTFTLGLGTLLWRYSGGYLRQPIITTLLLGSLYAIIFIQRDNKRAARYSFICGVLLGMIVLTDLSIVFAVLILGIYCIYSINQTSGISRKNVFSLLFIGAVIPLLVLGSYNFDAFGTFFTTPHAFEGSPGFYWMKTLAGGLQTPLFPSFFINLFSFSPIPPSAIAAVFQADIQNHYGSGYVETVIPYKGIFIQTPALFLAAIGLYMLFKKSKVFICIVISVALAIIIPLSKFTQFYSPNNFDTRYFLPSVPFIMLGLAPWWQLVFSLKRKFLKNFLLLVTITLTLISLYFGWIANLTNYGPNLTGDHRFEFSQLQTPLFDSTTNLHNLQLLFINTFPNLWNMYLLYGIYFPEILFLYLIVYETYSEKNKKLELERRRIYNKQA